MHFRTFAFAFLCAGLVIQARAQLDITMTMPVTTALRYEKLPAIVTLRNNTGTRIAPGTAGYVMSFDGRTLDSNPVSAGVLPVQAPTLEPGASITFTNDLTRVLDLSSVVQFSVMARAEYSGVGFVSQKQFVDILDGVEVARIRANDPKDGAVNHTLRVMNRDSHEHVFLRVDSEKGGWSFGAQDLGTILRATPPSLMLAADGTVHILHRAGPARFIYHQATANGQLLKAQAFQGDFQVVRMTAGADGQIKVIGKPADNADSLPILRQSPFRPDLHR